MRENDRRTWKRSRVLPRLRQCKNPEDSSDAWLLNHAERGSDQSGLRHELRNLKKVVHIRCDPQFFRNDDGVSGQQPQLVKATVAVARLAADHRSVGVDDKDSFGIRLPGCTAGIVQI